MPAMDRPREVYERLLSRPKPPGYPADAVLPDYGGLCIDGIPDLIASALGLNHDSNALVEAAAVPQADHVLLILLDGLGYAHWSALARREADVRALSERGTCIPVTTVFPSTTVAALSTYSTGLSPSQHGMLGYRLYLREVSAIVNMIQLSVAGGQVETPLPDRFPAHQLMAAETTYERLSASGVTSFVLLPRGIAQSGLSRLLYRGASHVCPSIGLSDMLATARDILARAQGRIMVTLYWPGLDSIGHARGAESEPYAAEAASIAAAIRREIIGRVRKTLVLVSSDHGFAAMRPADYLDVARLRELRDPPLLHPVGEPRASYVFLRSESRAALDGSPRALENGLFFAGASEALAGGLFGGEPHHSEARVRLGDAVIASAGRSGLLHPYPEMVLLPGMHGGLTAEEMVVPLLSVDIT